MHKHTHTQDDIVGKTLALFLSDNLYLIISVDLY